MKHLTACIAAFLLAASGSAGAQVSAPQASPPPAGHALVYVYRKDTWPAVQMDALFSINSVGFAALGANTYTWIHVPEGVYLLQQRWDMSRIPKVNSQVFSANAGAIHYFLLNVAGELRQMSWSFSGVDPARAVADLTKLRHHALKDTEPLKVSAPR